MSSQLKAGVSIYNEELEEIVGGEAGTRDEVEGNADLPSSGGGVNTKQGDFLVKTEQRQMLRRNRPHTGEAPPPRPNIPWYIPGISLRI